MSLRARVGQLSRRLRPPPGRMIVVMPSFDGEPIERTPGGFNLRVPFDAGFDPMAALTDEQRGLIRPADRVIVVCWAEDWRGETAEQDCYPDARANRRARHSSSCE